MVKHINKCSFTLNRLCYLHHKIQKILAAPHTFFFSFLGQKMAVLIVKVANPCFSVFHSAQVALYELDTNRLTLLK